MKKLTKFSNHIVENAFYVTQLEKDTFIKDEKSVMNAFFLSFVGWVSLLSSAKSRGRVKAYFKSDKKLRLTTIDDSNNDTSLIIKIMADGGYFKTLATPKEMTKFLVLAREGKINDVDPIIVRDWLNGIKPDMILKANTKVREVYDAFMKGGTLGQMAHDFRRIAKFGVSQKFDGIELVTLSQGLQINKSNGSLAAATGGQPVAAAAPSTATSAAAPVPTSTPAKSDSWSLADIVDNSPDADPVPAPSVRTKAVKAPKIKPPPVVKKATYPGHNELFTEFKDGSSAEDISKKYKFGKGNINGFLQFTERSNLYRGTPTTLAPPFVIEEIVKFLEIHKDLILQATLEKAIFKGGGKFLRPDFLKLYTYPLNNTQMQHLENTLYSTYISPLINNTDLPIASETAAFKAMTIGIPMFDQMIKMKLQDTDKPIRTLKAALQAMFLLDGKDVIKRWEAIGAIGRDDDGNHLKDGTLRFSAQAADTFNAEMIAFGKKYGVNAAASENVFVAKILAGTMLRNPFVWADGDALKGMDQDALKTAFKVSQEFKRNPNETINRILSARIATTIHQNNMWLYDWLIDNVVIGIGHNLVGMVDFDSYHSDYYKGKILEKALAYLVDNDIDYITNDDRQWTLPSLYGNIYKGFVEIGKVEANKDKLTILLKRNIKRIFNKRTDNPGWYSYGRYDEYNTRSNNDPVNTLLTKADGDEIDAMILDGAAFQKSQDDKDNSRRTAANMRGVNNYAASFIASGPINSYENMNAVNKKAFLAIIKLYGSELSITNFGNVIDGQFFKTIPDKDLYGLMAGGNLYKLPHLGTGGARSGGGMTEEDKVDVFNRFATTDEGFQFLLSEAVEFTVNMVESPKLMGIMSNSSLTNNQFSKIVDLQMAGINHKSHAHYLGVNVDAVCVTENTTLSKKAIIYLEKSLKTYDASGLSKNTSDYRNFMTGSQPAFIKYLDQDRKGAESLYGTLTTSMKRRFAGQYLARGDFKVSAGAAIVDPSQPIRPYEKLTDKRIAEILKYNNVTSEETQIPAKHIKTFDALDVYADQHLKDAKPVINDLQVKELNLDSKALLKLTIRMHQTKRNNVHGDNALLIKKAFEVSIPIQVKEHAEFLKNNSNSRVLIPMFHGTGSVAASMILRYGFKIIKRGDSSVTSRMLGDGVYGAVHIDKSQQYIGDTGWTRGIGTKGYIFSMEGALGENGKDYKAAGQGRDTIKSPEWAVFNPNAQLLIVRAYEVQIIASGTMRSIINDNTVTSSAAASIDQYIAHTGSTLSEGYGIMKFKKFMKEETEEVEGVTTYTFVNGLIPIAPDKFIDFEEFKSKSKNVTLEPSGYGPSIVVRGTEETNNYLFTGPAEFMVKHSELFNEYLKLINL